MDISTLHKHTQPYTLHLFIYLFIVFRNSMLNFLPVVLIGVFAAGVVAEKQTSSAAVKLEVYIESGCPVSQGFIADELTDVLARSDIVSILNYKFVPYGNTYRAENGTFIGYDEEETVTDGIECCSLYKLSGELSSIVSGDTSLLAFPFTSCVEANKGLSSSAETCWKSTMADTSQTSWDEIAKCSAGEFDKVMSTAALATPIALDTVPYILVDSTRYDQTTKVLLSTICSAYAAQGGDVHALPSCV
jgi:hypothetical protein